MSDYQQQIETVYDNQADRYRKAWLTFQALYVLEHPEPSKPSWWRQVPLTLFIFGIVAFAGMLLSALRTAPTFKTIAEHTVGVELATIEALLAVVVIELFLVTVRYVFVVQRGSTKIDNQTMNWMLAGFWIAFVVALAANLYATTKDLDAVKAAQSTLDLIASIVIGAAAPLLAVISGDIMGLLYLKSEAHRSTLREEYEADMTAWTAARDDRWKIDRSRFGATIRIQAEPSIHVPASNAPNALPDVSNGTPIGNPIGNAGLTEVPAASTLGHRKVQQATKIAEAYFREHPEHIAVGCEQLVPIIGVGKSTINKVQQRLREQAKGNDDA